MRKFAIFFLMVVLGIILVGCQSTQTHNQVTNLNSSEFEALEKSEISWDETLEAAKGTSVSFYGWGGSQQVNQWLDTEVADYMKENYNITLERVPMNIDEILNKLVGEKQLNAEGTIDVVWINGENFSTAKSNDLLYGPFTTALPNFKKYIDEASSEVQFDFGYPTDGFEAPYGKAQFVLICDSEKINFPHDHVELLELAKANPGMITYPALPDFTGSAFVRNIIFDVVDNQTIERLRADIEAGIDLDKETVRQAIMPAMDYLLELKPYLWREGKTYPSTNAQLDNMYSDGEVLMTMNYNPNHVAGKIQTGEFSETSQAFVLDKGTVGNTHFMAIPSNAVNKEAALVLINAILSPELQVSKYNPQTWGDLPVLDNSKLSVNENAMFESVPLGSGVPTQAELMSKRVAEMPVDLVPIIEEIWMETVPGE